jgi:hypothetical protein
MVSSFFKAVLLAAVLDQAVSSPPIRIGDARLLSATDVANLERLVPAAGARPWLFDGPRGEVPALQRIHAYLPPDFTMPELRRGAVVSLLRGSARALARMGIPPVSSTETAWIVTRTGRYAQVIVPGRTFTKIKGDGDINRPFVVLGQFDDEELVRLARFLRSSPKGPRPKSGPLADSVQGGWPIVSVARQADSIEVRLRRDDFAFQAVEVRPSGTGWVIVKMGLVII